MPIARLNNQEIYFEDTGGIGAALIFMHGFLMDKSMFDPQVTELSPQYRCIRFDARGFGQTRWDGRPFTLYDTVADCIALMDHLRIAQATIVGMSQGGFAALRLALRHPERVKALVLIATRSGADDEAFKTEFRKMRDTWREQGPLASLLEGLMTFVIGSREQTEALWEEWIPKWETRTGEQIFHAVNNVMDRDDLTLDQLRQIAAPALVIHGDADQGVPPSLGEALAKDLPNSKGFVRVPGAAHAVNLSHPQLVNPPLKQFLSRYA